MENNKIIPLKPIDDEKVEKKLKNLNFVQYGNFKELKNYKDGEVSYNPEVPIYSAQYQLKNSDYNVEQLRKRYNIPTQKAPKLLLKGSGNLKGSSVGYKILNLPLLKIRKKTFTSQIVSTLIQARINKYNY